MSNPEQKQNKGKEERGYIKRGAQLFLAATTMTMATLPFSEALAQLPERNNPEDTEHIETRSSRQMFLDYINRPNSGLNLIMGMHPTYNYNEFMERTKFVDITDRGLTNILGHEPEEGDYEAVFNQQIDEARRFNLRNDHRFVIFATPGGFDGVILTYHSNGVVRERYFSGAFPGVFPEPLQ